MKRSDVSGVSPTTPTGTTLSSFTDTDIFEGEFFLNTADDLLWIRTATGILPITLSGSTGSTIPTLNQVLYEGNNTSGFDIIISSADTIQYLGLQTGSTSTILGLDASGNTISTNIPAEVQSLDNVLSFGNQSGIYNIVMSSGTTIKYLSISSGSTSTILGLDASGNTITTSFTGSTPTLQNVLQQGNTTNGNDIIVSTGDTITSPNGENEISLQLAGQMNLKSTYTLSGNSIVDKLNFRALTSSDPGIELSSVDNTNNYITKTKYKPENIKNLAFDNYGSYVETTLESSGYTIDLSNTSAGYLTVKGLLSGTATDLLGIDSNKRVVPVDISGLTTPTLSQVLTSGNQTNGNNIVVSTGTTIIYDGLSTGTTTNFLAINSDNETIITQGGANGTSGTSGINGTNGSSGTSGVNGDAGSSGTSGINGTNGSSGTSGLSGSSGTSGASGSSGTSGINGNNGSSGTSGLSGSSGTSGVNGDAGSSGTSGINGTNGSSGTSGVSGASGSSGTSGVSGTNGSSGTSGVDGLSNSFFNYQAKTSSTTGDPGSGHIIWNNSTQSASTEINISDTDNNSNNVDVFLSQLKSGTTITIQDKSSHLNYQTWVIGTPVDNTTYWTIPITLQTSTYSFSNNQQVLFIVSSIPSGTSGTSGTSGVNGTNGSSGTSGVSGSSGSSGTSGVNGNNGSSGTSGVNGASGSSGTSGVNGASGSSGTSGINGTNGTSGTSGVNGNSNGVLGLTIDGAGTAITTGIKGYLVVPFNCSIDSWYIVGNTTGSTVIDVWRASGYTIPTSAAQSIAGSEKPTLSSQQINKDLSLSTWTTSLSTGDVLGFNVDSSSTITRATLEIKILKT